MKDAFVPPFVFAFRALVLRAPEGPRTPAAPLVPPPGLEPPEPLPEAENGYLRLVALTEGWPEEGMYPPDLAHRRKALPADRETAERALAPLRPLLERLDAALNVPRWQAVLRDDGSFPELAKTRRLAQALLLRGALDGRSEDRDRAVELARRVRRSGGVFIHFLVGLAMEKGAEGSFEGLDDDRVEAVRWELARFAVPRAHRVGPWEPVAYAEPPAWADSRRAAAWAVAGHPLPYDPQATLDALVAERDLMASGTADALQARAAQMGAPWPRTMLLPGAFGPGHASLRDLRTARAALRDVPNPYGRLSLAGTLRAAGNLAHAAAKAREK